MSILYSIKEAFAGFSKARVSTFITIFSSFFLIFLMAVFGILSSNVYRMANMLNASYDMQVFLANTLTSAEIQELQQNLRQNAEIKEIRYISKEEAAKEFKQAFGEDIFDALDENPLPASFVILLHENSPAKKSAEKFAQELQARPQIDEVVLHQQSLDSLLKFSRLSRIVLYALFALVFLGSFFLISNTIRLIIIARSPVIDTMKLVGATNAFIRRPFIIQGLLQGLLGGALASLLLFVCLQAAALQWPGMILVPRFYYIFLIGSGLAFGLIGSVFAVKRFL